MNSLVITYDMPTWSVCQLHWASLIAKSNYDVFLSWPSFENIYYPDHLVGAMSDVPIAPISCSIRQVSSWFLNRSTTNMLPSWRQSNTSFDHLPCQTCEGLRFLFLLRQISYSLGFLFWSPSFGSRGMIFIVERGSRTRVQATISDWGGEFSRSSRLC